MTLGEFLESSYRNMWIDYPGMKLYVRKGYHMIGGELGLWLDLANMEAEEPGTGNLDRLLGDIGELEGFEGIYVENVLTERLCCGLERRGFDVVDDSSRLRSYIRRF